MEYCCCSVTKLCLILGCHGLQHARLPCPSLSLGICSNPCPLSWWCYPTIVSSVTLIFSCPQSFTAGESFLKSQFYASVGQSIGASASASVLPMNIQGWFPLGLTGLISLPSKGLSRVFANTTILKHLFFGTQPSLGPTFTSVHNYRENHRFHYMDLSRQSCTLWVCLTFLPRNRCLLTPCLQSPSTVILELKKIKSGKNTGVGCHVPLQGIFPTQGSNSNLLYWQADSLPLNHLRSPPKNITES